MQTIFKILSLAFTFLFIAFALLQINDIDPLVWIYAYLLPGIYFFFRLQKSIQQGINNSVLHSIISRSDYFLPYGHYKGVALKDGMKTDYIEWARESLGLEIVFAAMILHLLQSHTKSL